MSLGRCNVLDWFLATVGSWPNRTSTGQQQFVGPGHQQRVTGESLGDPVGPRLPQDLARLANVSNQIVIEGASYDDTR